MPRCSPATLAWKNSSIALVQSVLIVMNGNQGRRDYVQCAQASGTEDPRAQTAELSPFPAARALEVLFSLGHRVSDMQLQLAGWQCTYQHPTACRQLPVNAGICRNGTAALLRDFDAPNYVRAGSRARPQHRVGISTYRHLPKVRLPLPQGVVSVCTACPRPHPISMIITL